MTPSSLTIHHLECTPVQVPLANSLRTASGVIAQAPLVLIDLHTKFGNDFGPVGRAYIFVYTPLALKPTVDMLRELAPLIEGKECAPVALHAMLRAQFRLLGYTGVVGMALAGIDMASWDALARANDQPLVRLLGAVPRAIPAYLSCGLDGLKRSLELAEQALARGFKAMKIKGGYATVAEDLRVMRGVQEVLGSKCGLMVDYNQSLTMADARLRLPAIDELNLEWIEEPVAQDNYAGHGALARELRTPIQIGENWFGIAEMAQAVALSASDVVMPDVMKIGGVTGWQHAAGLAAANNLPMSNHLFHEISAHLMCATPTSHWLEYMNFADAILATPSKIIDGAITPSDSPGCGIEWDEAAVKRYTVNC